MLPEFKQYAQPSPRGFAVIDRAPRVSVIIPCYNTARFVAETLESVYAQTFKDFEVVLVNDGSPDTRELEWAIAPWRDRITYIHTKNCGLAGARNNGIRASKGELIALLDSDDTWTPHYLELQVRRLDEDPTADIVYPRSVIFGEGSDIGKCSPCPKGDVTFTSLVHETNSVVVSVLARRSALEGAGLFDDTFRSCEDFDMWLRCLKNGSRIISNDAVLLRYRVRPDSLSADPVWMYEHAGKVLAKMKTSTRLTDTERRSVESAIRRFKGKKLFYEGKAAFLAGDFPLALQLLEQSDELLNSLRVRAVITLVRMMPQFIRAVYRLRLHHRIPFIWLVRRDVN